MKSFVSKLVREPALTLGVITAGLSLAVLFGVNISGDQMAGIGIFVGSAFALTRYLTTPSSEVVVQEKANGQTVAGGAASIQTGTPVNATVYAKPAS